MTFMTRVRAIYSAFERFAEAVEADPLEDLSQRVARLEQQASRPTCNPGPDVRSAPGMRP